MVSNLPCDLDIANHTDTILSSTGSISIAVFHITCAVLGTMKK